MRVFGSIVLWLFAAAGVIASILGIILLRNGGGDPLDRTRVISVIPAPSGHEAAVAYLHYVANYSIDVLAVKLVRPPFPPLGSDIPPAEEIIAVTHPLVSGWSSSKNPKMDDSAKRLIDIAWSATPHDVVDICPKGGARLVKFNTEFFPHEEHVTLCSKTEQ